MRGAICLHKFRDEGGKMCLQRLMQGVLMGCRQRAQAAQVHWVPQQDQDSQCKWKMRCLDHRTPCDRLQYTLQLQLHCNHASLNLYFQQQRTTGSGSVS